MHLSTVSLNIYSKVCLTMHSLYCFKAKQLTLTILSCSTYSLQVLSTLLGIIETDEDLQWYQSLLFPVRLTAPCGPIAEYSKQFLMNDMPVMHGYGHPLPFQTQSSPLVPWASLYSKCTPLCHRSHQSQFHQCRFP